MDLGSIAIAAVLLALCIIPFTLLRIKNAKKEKQKLTDLSNSAAEHGCRIIEHEFSRSYLIGMDTDKNFVFFHKVVKDRVTKQYVDLSTIEKCEVETSTRTYSENNDTHKVIERLELALVPRNKGQQVQRFEFYNELVSLQIYDELQSIQRWAERINNRISA